MASQKRYTVERIEHLRTLSSDYRRVLFWIGPLLLWVASARLGYPLAAFFCLIGTVAGFVVYPSLRFIVADYVNARARWDSLLERSDPKKQPAVDFPLAEGERVYFAQRAVRYEERHAGQSIIPRTDPKGAIYPRAVVGDSLCGDAGAIIRATITRTKTQGFARGIYTIVPVDDGILAITSHRAVFLDIRDSIEIRKDNIRRISAVPNSTRIMIEYPGRKPGESYDVDTLLIAPSMARRIKDPQFPVPATSACRF